MKKKSKLKIGYAQSQQGFTLVEVVLVMVVTGIVFVAIYGLYSHTVRQDMETRFEVMASNLAQEGIEIIRNSRDRAFLREHEMDYYLSNANCQPYFNGSDPACDNTRGVNVGYDGTKFYNCIGGACAAGTETPFRRNCTLSCDLTCNTAVDPNCENPPQINDGDCIRMTVTCRVEWDSFVNSALVRDITATSVLTSWQAE